MRWSEGRGTLHLDVLATGGDSLDGRLSDTLQVSCGADGADVHTPLVAPTEDGVAVKNAIWGPRAMRRRIEN